MANLRSSKKKARKDVKRSKANAFYRRKLDEILHEGAGEAKPSGERTSQMYQLIDKSAKRGIISSQRASRLKSRVT